MSGFIRTSRWRKIPFTCTFPQFQQTLMKPVIQQVAGFLVFANILPGLEAWLVAKPSRFIMLPLAIAIPVAFWQWLNADTGKEPLILQFEDSGIETVQLLGLKD